MSIGSRKTGEYVVGVISDTHGVLRPEAAKAFEGVDLIVHAGDIGKPEVLGALGLLAPVSAVRGNMDVGAWVEDLPETGVVEVGGVRLYVLHDANKLDLDPAAAGFSAVISGHTHRAAIERQRGILFLNPGTAALFSSLASIALLRVRGGSLEAHLVVLQG
jgi:putative phosphoesterase